MRRLTNAAVWLGVRTGIVPKRFYLLTVCGRKSGKHRTIPIIVLTRGRERWLIAPYGERAWVKNARAAGRVTLSRGFQKETVALDEVRPLEAAPVVKRYLSAALEPLFSKAGRRSR
jgi:deazaflavin-dependent oxidoreductase (nitroreductase family)